MSANDSPDKRFKVALSFPGEHRPYVSKVAEILAAELGKDKVFFDNWYTAELTRPNLDIYLQNIYHKDSELLVPFLCKDYERKDWCQLEWKVIRDLMKKRRDQDIMPMRFDETYIPGLFDLDGYLDLRQRRPKETAKLILQRVKLNETGKIAHDTPSTPKAKPWKIYGGIVACTISAAIAYYFISNMKPDPSIPIQLENQLTLIPISVKPFEMGGEKASEKPIHTVVLPDNFWMSQTEISFDQYAAYAREKQLAVPFDEGWGRVNRPVINVSATEADAFAGWLTDTNQKGLSCRLPTEAEWEYAARAGSTTAYAWGDAADRTKANCRECDSLWSQQKQTAPVGSFEANTFGLKDMHGNVAEWVQDVWHDNYDNAPRDGSVWLRGGHASKRVTRGGSWSDGLDDIRSASRRGALDQERFRTIGFRVVCSQL